MKILRCICPNLGQIAHNELTILIFPASETEPYPVRVMSLTRPGFHTNLFRSDIEKWFTTPTRADLDRAIAHFEALITELRKPIPPAYKVGDEVYAVNTGHCSSPCVFEAQLANGVGLFSRAIRIDGHPKTIEANGLHYWFASTEKFQKEPNRC